MTKYRISNIDYWRQFTRNDPRIENWKNDETHEMPDDLAQIGLHYGVISEIPQTDESMEEMLRKEK